MSINVTDRHVTKAALPVLYSAAGRGWVLLVCSGGQIADWVEVGLDLGSAWCQQFAKASVCISKGTQDTMEIFC